MFWRYDLRRATDGVVKVYASDPFAYDFNSALGTRATASMICNLSGPPPTRSELIAHARAFGMEEVEAVAERYGIDMTVAPIRTYAKHRTKAQLQRGLDRAERALAEITPTMTNKDVLQRVDEAIGNLDGRRRLPAEMTAKLVHHLDRTGMVYRAIADRIGVTDATVLRALNKQGQDTTISAEKAA